MMRPALFLTVVSLMMPGCLASSPPGPGSPLETGEEEPEGVLESKDISVILQDGTLWIKITPMAQEILRYTNADTRRTYTRMLRSQGATLAHADDGDFKPFFVQFQGRSENETYFDPTDLNIVHQGKRYKPDQIVPISSTFDKRILKLYGNPEMAIYAFSGEIDLDLPIEFKYKTLSSNQWDEIIRTVESSKLRVR